jgi:hypothetical protein
MVATYGPTTTLTENLQVTNGSVQQLEAIALTDTNAPESFEIDMNTKANTGCIPLNATGTMVEPD